MFGTEIKYCFSLLYSSYSRVVYIIDPTLTDVANSKKLLTRFLDSRKGQEKNISDDVNRCERTKKSCETTTATTTTAATKTTTYESPPRCE